MGDRNMQQSGLLCRKTLFCWFAVAISLVMLSMIYFGSTGRPRFVDHNLLPNDKVFSVIENRITPSRARNDEAVIGEPSLSDESARGEPETQNCDPSNALVKVYMYDMPSEFHFGLLDWKPDGNSIWPDIGTEIPGYPGGLNLQHSIEYWLTLDLLSSRFPDRPGPCTAVRVDDSRQADIVFVPFFSSLSYNRHSKDFPPENISRNKLLQQKLVKYLADQEEWKRSGGRDHVIMAHHPNSMLDARSVLFPCVFILSDFGRYHPNIANVEKDLIAPYKHLAKTFVNDSAGFEDRPILLYFRGAIYRKEGGNIRQELYYLLKDEKDVHFSFGSIQANGINKASQGMHSAKFCLNIAGDTPSSNRLFDAIVSHCVPVIISDDIELPFEDVLDYSKFCIFVRSSDATKEGFLMNLIRGISREKWTKMWERLKEVERHFEFQYPSQKDDAVQMIWQALARKVPAIRQKVHRARRFSSVLS
ncbi:probable arabinosyltransferase ARAD1 [Typha angustifolia]|uniref:probable arabinosyltransferase ARAD1 n=1 Tax=Typha angustifolia TaxID=59011 RepID=UPI003C2C41A1